MKLGLTVEVRGARLPHRSTLHRSSDVVHAVLNFRPDGLKLLLLSVSYWISSQCRPRAHPFHATSFVDALKHDDLVAVLGGQSRRALHIGNLDGLESSDASGSRGMEMFGFNAGTALLPWRQRLAGKQLCLTAPST